MAFFALPTSRLVDPVFVLLVVTFVGLWLSRRRPAHARALGQDEPRSALEGPEDPPPTARGRMGRALLFAFRALRARRAGLGRAAAWAACAALWLLSTPVVASSFARAVSLRPRDIGPDLAGTTPEQRAMVVLGATISPDETGVPAMERLSDAATERCIGAARLYHTHGFRWIIVSGRHPDLARDELTRGMADLIAALGVPRERILLESEALDTRENALFSTRMTRDLGMQKVVVVTSALHMPRSLMHFRDAGLEAVPAPVKLNAPPPWKLEGLIPTAESLRRSQRAVHEVVGRLEP